MQLKYADARYLVERLLTFDSDNLQAHLTAGSIFYNYKSCQMAVYHFEIVLKIRKTEPRDAALRLSRLAHECFDMDLALNLIEKATDPYSLSSTHFIDMLIKAKENMRLNSTQLLL